MKYIIVHKGKETPGYSLTFAAAVRDLEAVAKANNIPMRDLSILPRESKTKRRKKPSK